MARQIGENFPVVIGREFTPHIASDIFNLLDKQELTKSRSVSTTWKDVVDSRTNLWTDPKLYMKAVTEGNLDICKIIIQKVDNKNPLIKRFGQSLDQQSPLHIAAQEGHVEICRLIISHVEDKNPKNDEGNTPLLSAATSNKPGSAEVYRLIMDEVDDKNPKNKWGYTPLHGAALYGNFEVSKLIVENVDEKNPATLDHGSTPLHMAATYGYKDIFRLIFEKVDDKNPPDKHGDTPLHLAAAGDDGLDERVSRQPYVEICRLILDNVDNKYPVNSHGETPLDRARKERIGELEELEQLWLQYEEDQ